MKNIQKKIFIILLLCTISSSILFSQNLVPNHSFENLISCPIGHYMSGTDPWIIQNWNVPPGSITTPDLFSTCHNTFVPTPPHLFVGVPNNFAGICYPKTGENYIGILLKYGLFREYVQTGLVTPLIAGQKYLCGFYVQKSDSCLYSVGSVGMHISNIQEYQSGSFAMTSLFPQIKNISGTISDFSDWTKVEGIYTATGGEQYITIGNFNSNATSQLDSLSSGIGLIWPAPYAAYYYIDDAYIIPYSENIISNGESNVCKGENLILSAKGSAVYNWYINGNLYSHDSIINIAAESDLNIVVTGYYDTLKFNVQSIDCPIDCSTIPIFPNVFTPNNDKVNDFFYSTNLNTSCYKISIFNRWGQKLFQSDSMYLPWDGKNQDGQECPDGVYYYIASVEDKNGKLNTYTGHLSLFK
ncbi:MAG: gliding motility-associated C-terminal domain-containing protein [Bacteroidota bacterium]